MTNPATGATGTQTHILRHDAPPKPSPPLPTDHDPPSSEWAESLSTLPTPLLQSKLSSLLAESQSLSSTLTSRLASSPSGQSLLHIGPSLSTLPPDLSSLMAAISPLLKDVAEYQKLNEVELVRVVAQSKILKRECKRAVMAQSCRKFLKDLIVEEKILLQQCNGIDELKGINGYKGNVMDSDIDDQEHEENKVQEKDEEEIKETEGDRFLLKLQNLSLGNNNAADSMIYKMASLERVAYFTFLSKEKLEYSKEQVTMSLTGSSSSNVGDVTSSSGSGGVSVGAMSAGPSANSTAMTQDLEMAQFIMKLSPRIRKLEKNVNDALNIQFEQILQRRMVKYTVEGARLSAVSGSSSTPASTTIGSDLDRNVELLVLGHLLRSFVFTNRGSDAEAIFARVAVMPIVRKYVSIGKLDEGGSRGECAGLFLLLQQIVMEVRDTWGDVLRMSESMFALESVENSNDENGRHHADASSSVQMHSDTRQEVSCKVEIDLITAGVWVPIVTALLADPVMKVAIFSPGIANIFQRNYLVLDTFLSELASNLLSLSNNNVVQSASMPNENEDMKILNGGTAIAEDEDKIAITQLYYQPQINSESIHIVQSRVYAHPMTVDYAKKWNLPIYYQLRFGEVCSRLEKAIKGVEMDGWDAQVFTGTETTMLKLRNMNAMELPFFMEFIDSLNWLWRQDVFLRPLTHRFLRGTIQLIGRVMTFIKEGLNSEIKFGSQKEESKEEENERDDRNLDNRRNYSDSDGNAPHSTRVESAYSWSERLQDVAAVSWELSVLAKYFVTDHIQTIEEVVCPPSSTESDTDINASFEISEIISEVMMDASKDVSPLVNEMWNDIIVKLITKKCTAPLAAVKGVAATYRMTNRPPPTQASPYVYTILRPLSEFETTFSKRIPSQIGLLWKKRIVDTVSEEYSASVSELIETVQKTEEALKNRKLRRALAGGMSDGEKVKLQLYLDQGAFSKAVEEIGIDPTSVQGIQSLVSLTQEAENLIDKVQTA